MALAAISALSGCGAARHIPIEEFRPEKLEAFTFEDPLEIHLNHHEKLVSFNEEVIQGLTDYLKVHAPSIHLTQKKSTDLTFDLHTRRMGMLISANVEMKARLHDKKGAQIKKSRVFISQKCTNPQVACQKNERYNIGLHCGKMFLEGITESYQTFLAMDKPSTPSQRRAVAKARRAEGKKVKRQRKKVQAFILKNDYLGLKTYTNNHPTAAYFIKSKAMRLMFTGPKGMKVGDIRKLVKEGRSETIVVSLIKRVETPYKAFTL